MICSNKGRKNNRRIIGIVWKLKKNNIKFLRSAGKNNWWIFEHIRCRPSICVLGSKI